MGVMWVELQISEEMAIWDDSFKYAGQGGFGAELVSLIGKPNKTFKGGFQLEPYLGFQTKKGGIPNKKMFGSVTHSIFIYCVSITNFSRICFICCTLIIFPDKVFVKEW